MIKRIKVALKQNPYEIIVGKDILSDLGVYLKKLRIGGDAVIISNPVIIKHYGLKLANGLKAQGISVKFFSIPAGEKSKSAQAAFKLLEQIASYDISKKIFIIALGGGVVGDLAGFVASTYKRGIPYVQVPTTLLAQVDSAIGGKVAIDLGVGKNLVGSFYQPKLVFSDVSLLKTLDQRQIRNGLAEVVKYGVIYDKHFFDYVSKNLAKLLACETTAMADVVLRSSAIKTKVVLADEKETKGIRTILNFGHTVGHAIEAAAGFNRYHHGEAIGLGMRVAAEISVQMKMFSVRQQEQLNKVLTLVGLPQRIKGVSLKKILSLMRHDKKFVAGCNRFVLALKVGRVRVVENISQPIIINAIKKYM